MSKRSKYDITLLRLTKLSPADLVELGQRLKEHPGGLYVLKLIQEGFTAGKQAEIE